MEEKTITFTFPNGETLTMDREYWNYLAAFDYVFSVMMEGEENE